MLVTDRVFQICSGLFGFALQRCQRGNEMNIEGKFCLKWNDFQENIKTSFNELRSDRDFTDVTLACEDGELEGHKVILSSCSPLFKRLLKRTHEHRHPLLYMRGLKANQLTTVVDFIYHGEVNINQGELEGFLLLAKELELEGLTGEVGDIGLGFGFLDLGDQQTQGECKADERLLTENDTKSSMKIEDKFNNMKQVGGSYSRTESTQKPKVQIANEILQMRETMYAKVDGRWTCKVCKFTSRAGDHLREHVEKHINGLEYPCNLCGKVMRSSKSLRIHYGSRCPFNKRQK